MVEHADRVALSLYDAETSRLLYASPRYYEIFERGYGIDRERIAGLTWHELWRLPVGEESEHFDQVVQTGQPRRLPELRIPSSPGGSAAVWDCSLIPIETKSEGRSVKFVMASAVEVTQPARARDELRRLDRMKDEFLSLASHEMRTPLVPLTAYSEILGHLLAQKNRDGEWETKIAEIGSKIRRQVAHMARLTDDLIDVARLQSGKLSLIRKRVDLRDLAKEAVDQATMTSPKPPILFEPGDRPLAVDGDEARLIQVVVNLLTNALKYASRSPQIDLRLHQNPGHDSEPGQAVIEVQDYGPGIPPQERDGLFTRFFQGSREERGARSGLGLGLFISKGIVDQHGGRIAFDSSETGTSFRVELPLAD